MRVLIIFIVAWWSCDSNAKMKRDYYSNGKIKSEVEIKNGKRNGVARMFYSNGQEEKISHYENDLLNGEYTSYDSAGNILANGFFLRDKAVGPITYYYRGNLIIYNERDLSGKVYYVLKFDSTGTSVQNEEGHCFSKNWFEDFTVNNGLIYQLTFFYAQPPGYINDLKAYVGKKEVPVKKTIDHQAKVELENTPNPNYEISIVSSLRDKFGEIKCRDTLVKAIRELSN